MYGFVVSGFAERFNDECVCLEAVKAQRFRETAVIIFHGSGVEVKLCGIRTLAARL